MRYLLLIVGLLIVWGCSRSGRPLTDVERSEMASRTIGKPVDQTVILVNDFLVSQGYTIDQYDEKTNILSTKWVARPRYPLTYGTEPQMIKAKIRGAGRTETLVEFLIYTFTGYDNPDLVTTSKRYEQLMGVFDAFLAGK